MGKVCLQLCILLEQTGPSFAVAAYVTSYISKMDKFTKVGWRDVMHELDSQLRASADAYKGKSCCIGYKRCLKIRRGERRGEDPEIVLRGHLQDDQEIHG